MFNKRMCFLQLVLKTDMGRTAPCSVHVVKVIVTHALASVPVLLAKWDPAVSKVTKQDPRSFCQLVTHLEQPANRTQRHCLEVCFPMSLLDNTAVFCTVPLSLSTPSPCLSPAHISPLCSTTFGAIAPVFQKSQSNSFERLQSKQNIKKVKRVV